jgi:uncharacterized membrane protein YgcG
MIVYNSTWLHNLNLLKTAKQWQHSNLISKERFAQIQNQYESNFYHPNFIVRILLFIATAIVLGAITGLLVLGVMDIGEDILSGLSIIYGVVSWLILDRNFIRKNNHYKSGITEALLYHSILFIVLGCVEFFEDTPEPYAIVLMILFAFASYRYLDLISTTGALLAFGMLIFFILYHAGGRMQQIIPLAFIAVFSPLYFLFRNLGKRANTELWKDCLIVAEGVCLLLIYAAGNYLVVRELSIAMLNIELLEGQDIPLAILFYGLTIVIPILYLYAGIRNKDLVLIRVSLIAVAFSAFTFKYYYNTGHHEITFTVSGLFMLITSVALLRWLKTPRKGYTRENILSEKWANSNAQAFIISQTLGVGTKPEGEQSKFGGGESGGGGANSTF